jgi:NADPH:quinone reductase-like Zn-dependent oxidoreductase
LIYGASGGVGSYAVQRASSFGAEVTAVCSTRNVDQARSLGAAHVIDYTRESFPNGSRYDLILGANGYRPLSDYGQALKPKGRFVLAGGSIRQLLGLMISGGRATENGEQSFSHMGATRANGEDMQFLKERPEEGRLKPVIEHRYPLAGVPEAIGYLEKGHARGKVVITIVDETEASP